MRKAVMFFCMLASSPLGLPANRPVGQTFLSRSEIIAQHGMAATSHPLATQTALRILQAGGSALDAAIAANAVLSLTEPTGCGLGGDLFTIVWDPQTRRLHGLNASGRSPHSLTRQHFLDLNLATIPQDGPLSVSVPGCVDGWFELHQKFGKLDMATLLEPAINYANEGFPVSEVIAKDWAANADKYAKWPGFKDVFMPGGQAPRKGEIFRNPALARTLGLLAREGRNAFYKGTIARELASFIQEHGGFLSERDLADHRSEWMDPVSTNYRGYDIWELPPNGQGIAALQMLNILEPFDLRAMGFGSAEYLHLLVEAKKLAFEDRARFYADPAFHKIPVGELISKPYAEKRRQLLDPAKAAPSYPAGNPALDEGDTIYLTTADTSGMMVSLIQSNFRGMGSGMTPPTLGFCLQNRGELFSLEERHWNCYAPHKRPFHTIIPAFITKEGEPHISFGVMGGAMQPQGHVQIVVNLIDFGMGLQEAGDAPRLQHLGSSEPTGAIMNDGGAVCLEHGFPETTIRELLDRGHKIQAAEAGTFGGFQAIRYDAVNKVFYGASESRKDGQAAGY